MKTMDKFDERIEQIEKFASQCYEDGEKYSASLPEPFGLTTTLQDYTNEEKI